MNNLDGYGCRAPNKPVETPNKCECNKEWRVRDGVREVVPVPAEGVTVSCVNNSSGLVAKVNGFCAIVSIRLNTIIYTCIIYILNNA